MIGGKILIIKMFCDVVFWMMSVRYWYELKMLSVAVGIWCASLGHVVILW